MVDRADVASVAGPRTRQSRSEPCHKKTRTWTLGEKDLTAARVGRPAREHARARRRNADEMRPPRAGRRLALSSSPASRRRRRRDVQVAPSPFVVDRADVASVDDRARAEAVATRVVSNEQKDAPADALREEPNRRTRRSGAERACARESAQRSHENETVPAQVFGFCTPLRRATATAFHTLEPSTDTRRCLVTRPRSSEAAQQQHGVGDRQGAEARDSKEDDSKLVQPDGWARGEREGYGGPCDVTSLSLSLKNGSFST